MLRKILMLTVAMLLLWPALALAADVPDPQHPLALPSVQFWGMVVGAVAPLAGYVLNHYAPWCSERVKAIVQVGLAAAAAAVYQAWVAGGFAVDTAHLEVVGSAVLAALLAHKLLYVPAGINVRLLAGSNADPSAAT